MRSAYIAQARRHLRLARAFRTGVFAPEDAALGVYYTGMRRSCNALAVRHWNRAAAFTSAALRPANREPRIT